MVHFIVGRGGFGKTEKLFEKIAEHAKAGERCWLFTPEQVSFEYEKKLALREDVQSENVEVLNFTRLTKLCFNRIGGPDRELLSPMASFLLMSLALEEIRDMLSIYRRNYQSYGFIAKLVETGEELRLSGIDPERLAELSYKQPEGYLREKSYELSLIFDTYHAMMSSGFFDESDALDIAAEKLSETGALELLATVDDGRQQEEQGICLFFDGFSGFTALQYRVLRPLMAQAKEVYFALPFDEEEPDNPVFAASAQTLSRIRATAKDLKLEIAPILSLSKPYRFQSEDLVSLERLAKGEDATLGADVLLYPARDGYDEIEWVCQQISAMVRDEGYRYKDFTIIARSMGRYRSFIGETLTRYGIPAYMDERKDTASQMSVKWLLLCGELLAKGISTPLILEMLKSPMLALPHQGVAELENYCYTWSLRGKAWGQELVNHPDGLVEGMTREAFCRLKRCEALRRDVMKLLSPLLVHEGEVSGRDFAGLLYGMFIRKGYLRDIRLSDKRKGRLRPVSGKLPAIGGRPSQEVLLRHGVVRLVCPEANLRSFGEKGQMDSSARKQFLQEQSMLWEQICQALDLFATVVNQSYLSKGKLLELLELVSAGFETASAPPTLDQVLVGTADRIRPVNPKCVFVIGAVEGEYPPPAMLNSLFTQGERMTLCVGEDDLSDTLEELNARERYYCYTALSSASHKVCISYPRSHSTTKELLPAELFTNALEHGGKLSPVEESGRTINPQTALYRLAYLMEQDHAKAKSLEIALADHPQVQRLKEHRVKKNFALSDTAVTKSLFGERMRLSPSRVDRYNSCPFSYYVSGGLGVRPRTKAEITPLASGSVIHKVLEEVVNRYGGRGIAQADPDELRTMVYAQIEEYMARLEGGKEALSPRNRYLFLRLGESIYELVIRLGEEFLQSAFEPIAFEKALDENSDTPPFVLQLPDGTEIQVVGTIDRVDVAEIGGKKYIRVVDYKSGGKKFALSDVYYGLNMQMLIYLFSIWKEGRGKYADLLPAGVLYMPVIAKHHTTDRLDDGTQLAKERNAYYRMNGLLLADEEVLSAMDTQGGVFIPKLSGRSTNSFASLEELGLLVKRVQEQLSLMAYQLLRGRIEAKPTVTPTQSPCSYCDYSGICGFEDGDPVREKVDVARDLLLGKEIAEKEATLDV